MTIGEYIKFYRKKHKLTQKKLSEITGIAEITIRQYEAGKYEPKNENLSKLANAFGIKPLDLLGWDIPGNNYVSMEERIDAASRIGISPFDATGVNLELAKNNPEYVIEKTQEISQRLEQDIRENFIKNSVNYDKAANETNTMQNIRMKNFSNNINYLMGHYHIDINTLSHELSISIDTIKGWVGGEALPNNLEQKLLEKYFHLEDNTLIDEVILGIFAENPDDISIDIALKNSFLKLGLREEEIESLKEYINFLKSRRPEQNKDMGEMISKINSNKS